MLTMLATKVRDDDKRRIQTKRSKGNCLERIGIPNEAMITIDRNLDPVVGDLVHCCKTAGCLSTLIKKVISINNGVYRVSTAYVDETQDYEFDAGEILGVVTKVTTLEGETVYERAEV